jgi:putative ABC transport system permease protein
LLTLRAVGARAGSSLALFAVWASTVLGSVLVAGLSSAAHLPAGSAGGLVLLGVVALAAHGAVSARSRTPETALAQLRGLHGARLLWTAVREPVTVVVVASVAGTALAAAGGPVLARRWTGTGSAFQLGAEEWVTAAVLLVVGLVVIVAVSWRTTYQPLHDKLEGRSGPRPTTAAGAFLTLLVVFGAAVSTYQARQLGSSRADWVSFLTPALIGLTAGQVACWLLTAACRAAQGSARLDRRLASFLTVRRLSRRAGAVAAVRVVVAGVVVAGVAAAAWVGTRAWSESTARIDTGGPIAFEVPSGALQAYVASHRADPEGRWLMAEAGAAADPTDDSARDLFADTARWGRVVGDFFAGTAVDDVTGSVDDVGSGLPAATAAKAFTVRFSGSSARRALLSPQQARRIRRGVAGYDFVPLQFLIDYVDDRGQAENVSVPPGHGAWHAPVQLGRGTVGYTVPVPGCSRACAVRDVLIQGRTSGDLRVLSMEFGTMRLLQPDGRGMTAVASHQVTSSARRGGGLSFTIADAYFPHPLLAWKPQEAAAIATTGLRLPIVKGQPQADGLDGDPRPVRVIGRTRALPLLGREGVLLDLSNALRGAGGQIPGTSTVVVARSDTPPAVLRTLRATGVVGAKRTWGAALERIDRDNAALGVRLYLLVAAFGLLVCAISVVASVTGQRRERTLEAAALRSVGVDAANLARSYRAEAVWLAAAVGCVGLVGAWVGCRALLAVLPLVDSGRFGLGFDSTPRVDVLAAVAIAAGGFVAVVVVLALRLVAASSPPDRLREEAR